MPSELDNSAWQCLSGSHAGMAAGTGGARRYATGYPPLVGFSDPQVPDFDALAPWCAAGEILYCEAWAGVTPRGWRVLVEKQLVTMFWDAPAPTGAVQVRHRSERGSNEIVQLRREDVAAVVSLAADADFTVFGPRAIELGEFFGIFIDGRLIAMAGERLFFHGNREISAVCTHPDFEGRGYARRLVNCLIARELARGELPFLHVVSDNIRACGLYTRMGFKNHGESTLRVVLKE